MNPDDTELDSVVAAAHLVEVARRLSAIATEELRRSSPRYERISVHATPIAVLPWLAANSRLPRLYWSGRNSDTAIGGLGVADSVSGYEARRIEGRADHGGNGVESSGRAAGRNGVGNAVRPDSQSAQTINGAAEVPALQLENTPSLNALRAGLSTRLQRVTNQMRYYGGMRFDVTRPASAEWRPFGGYNFVLPRVEVHTTTEGSEVVLNLVPNDWKNPVAVLRALSGVRFSKVATPDLAMPVFRDNYPDEAGWKHNIEWSLDAFSRSRLAKVVLARRAILGFEEPVDPVALMDELSRNTSSCYHFMFSPSAPIAFVGASPERLFRLDGRSIWSEAVAGTRRRGETEGADAELCKELLMSEKDQREHVYVRQSIKETLSALCSELHVDASASEMLLTRGRHLVSRVEGVADDGVEAVDFLFGLHPTPAVGGYPTADALDVIAKLEGFDRGWYAAPVGWIGADAAEFAVAIRSGLVEDKQVSLYSGAGIVGGSTADSEWAEIEYKIADFVSVFGVDGSTAK